MKTLYNFFLPSLVFEYFDQTQYAVRHLGIITDLTEFLMTSQAG